MNVIYRVHGTGGFYMETTKKQAEESNLKK